MNYLAEPRKTAPEKRGGSARRAVVILFFVALGVYGLGWGIFHFAATDGPPAPVSPEVTPLPEPSPPPASPAPETAPEPIPPTTEASPPAADSSGEATRPVPPGPTPPGVSLATEISFERCWDDTGLRLEPGSCDKLGELVRRLEERLYLAERCREEVSAGTRGLLLLGMEVDFTRVRVGLWSQPGSGLPGSARVATCLDDALARFPLEEIEHGSARYQIDVPIRFTPASSLAALSARSEEESPTEAVEPTPAFKPRSVTVIRDRVRVRGTPGDGHVLGMLSRDARVVLLDHRHGWCQVMTARQTKGWMVCWSLDL